MMNKSGYYISKDTAFDDWANDFCIRQFLIDPESEGFPPEEAAVLKAAFAFLLNEIQGNPPIVES